MRKPHVDAYVYSNPIRHDPYHDVWAWRGLYINTSSLGRSLLLLLLTSSGELCENSYAVKAKAPKERLLCMCAPCLPPFHKGRGIGISALQI